MDVANGISRIRQIGLIRWDPRSWCVLASREKLAIRWVPRCWCSLAGRDVGQPPTRV